MPNIRMYRKTVRPLRPGGYGAIRWGKVADVGKGHWPDLALSGRVSEQKRTLDDRKRIRETNKPATLMGTYCVLRNQFRY